MAIRRSNQRENRLFGRLSQRWQDLPVGVKLRLSISVVVLMTFGAGILNVQNIFGALRFATLAHDQQQQISNIDQFLTQTFNNVNNNVLDIVKGILPDLSTYSQSLNATSPDSSKQALATLNNNLAVSYTHLTLPTIYSV